MKKLLSANLARLGQSKIFWVLELGCFLLGCATYLLVVYNTRNLGNGWLQWQAHSYFYMPILYLPVGIAIFSCFFFGTEYSDGTIRNKLVVGHSREAIYLANLLTTVCVIGLFLLACYVPVFIVGIPLAGKEVVTCVEMQPWRIANSTLLLTEYGALFVLLSTLDSNKARNVLVCLMTALLLILLGVSAYGRYSEPEFVQQVVYLPDGGMELKDGIPNSQYLTGTARIIVQWIATILPTGSAMMSLDKNFSFMWQVPLTAILVTALLTLGGIRLFQKKDIK